ncbi:MAG: hypothetical protein JJT95_02975 [Pararhodobacter sp.]|nr:hypothetical protein [Pararhodobacter sp.]
MLNIGNIFALSALLAWPLVIVIMFRVMTLERALIWSILGGYMLLPQLSEINFPGIPAFNKVSIPNLTVFVVIVVMLGRVPRLLPRSWVGRVLMVLFVLSPAVTVLNNLEPVRFGIQNYGGFSVFDPSGLARVELPALRAYDSFSELARQFIILLPFFLAREFLRSEAAIREMLRALVIAALIYTLPMLLEMRISPQLHTWVYGFFQHNFLQAIREGGYRPFVFMPHGLWVALFAFKAFAAAVALTITTPPERQGRMLFLSLWLFVLLLLCRSLGPIMLALMLLPLLLFMPRRVQLLFGVAVSVLVLAYPMLRGAGLVPTDAIVAQLERFNPDRAQSLEFRFMNEDRVIAHVADKPLFGWGGWGRFVPYDLLTGNTRVIVDGQWIITIGHYGWLGYIALFGLLALPLFSLWWQSRRELAPQLPFAVSAMVLIYAANLLDLLPNATLIPFTLLMGGAILGHAEEMRRSVEKAEEERTQPRRARVTLGMGTGEGTGTADNDDATSTKPAAPGPRSVL